MQGRTHNCGELRLSNAGEQVRLVGWYENIRKVSKNLGFLILRDFYGTTQIVVETEEIMEQLSWQVPDYIAISVGDGCTIAGLWKGLKDLYAIGFIDRLPRLISAQAEGCCPINRAIAENKPWEPMEENTLADSIAVGVPRNADKALMAIRESDGIVVNVSDEEIMAAQKLLGRTCGVFGEPAGVTGAAGVKKLCEQGVIGKDDTVVSVVTGNGLKDVANAIKAAGEPISIPSDMDRLLAAFAEKGITVE